MTTPALAATRQTTTRTSAPPMPAADESRDRERLGGFDRRAGGPRHGVARARVVRAATPGAARHRARAGGAQRALLRVRLRARARALHLRGPRPAGAW